MAQIVVPIAMLAFALIFAALAIAATFFLLRFAKNFLVNSALGVALLLAINFFGASSGFSVPLSLGSIVVAGLFGLAGVGVLVVLALFGIMV